MDNSTHENPRTELLIRYLDGEMNDVEKAGLENQLPVDPAMQQELDNLRLARQAVKQYGLQQQVSAVRKEMLQESKTPVKPINRRKRTIRYSLSIAAAAIIILLGIGSFWLYQLTPGKVYASNYETYQLQAVRSGEGSSSPVENAYRNRNYPELIRLTRDSPGIKEGFLLGMAYMEQNNYPEAIRALQEVIGRNAAARTTIYKDDAEYYTALAQIKLQHYDQALVLLNKIKDDPQHLYHSRVSGKLIRKVKLLRWRN